ncbi:hypothetical protein IAD21_03723 [Abditibacteriota bacterium]|nr:hypothetical protein IAD21_03723 [Abditibacteriota bacterium]
MTSPESFRRRVQEKEEERQKQLASYNPQMRDAFVWVENVLDRELGEFLQSLKEAKRLPYNSDEVAAWIREQITSRKLFSNEADYDQVDFKIIAEHMITQHVWSSIQVII